MTDQQDRQDDVNSISQQLQSITTNDPEHSVNEEFANDGSKQKFKNGKSMNSINEKKRFSLDENNWASCNLPGNNLPEKILFVIDTTSKVDYTPFETTEDGKFTPLYMIKRVVEIFLMAKSRINTRHQYALMILQSNSVAWLCDFTSKHKDISTTLEMVRENFVKKENQLYDLGPCFQMISEKMNMGKNSTPPENVSRVILIYSRSESLPTFVNGKIYFDRLYQNSHFYLDCLYVHEPPSDDTDCQDVYTKLGELDANSSSYVLEVGRNLAALHANMAKLMAHPLQRVKQDDAPYTFNNTENSQDSHTNV